MSLTHALMQKCRCLALAVSMAAGLVGSVSVSIAEAGGSVENYTFRLTQSTSNYEIWTTPPSERVFLDAQVPAATGDEIKVYAAQNEFEPFQVVVKPAESGSVNVGVDPLGAGITLEVHQVRYVNVTQVSDGLGRTGPYPDPLWPLTNPAGVNLTAGENTAFWFSVSVPAGTPHGDYVTNVHVAGIGIPVRLHVFNFAIPEEPHVGSQMNVSYGAILDKYGVPGTGTEYWAYLDKIKQYFMDHRLTPASVLWPGGLTGGFADPLLSYDCGRRAFSDGDGIWGFESPAARYIGGYGTMGTTFAQPFNGGAGFKHFMAAGFSTNDPSVDQRRATFCGQTRGASDWLQNPTSAYNTAWFDYVAALQGYLGSLGYLDEAYHYFANEPQDQADYDAVAWYSRYSHAAAPDLKLMVSEGARPEIYDQPGAHVDIWMPVLNEYAPAVSQAREKNNDEATWVSFLQSTRPPYFNPVTLDHPGIEGRLTGWFLWKYRVRGVAHYSLNDWNENPWTDPMTSGENGSTFMLYPPSTSNTPIPYGANDHRLVPSIRFELMRDSLEDYEYLYRLAGNRPEVDVANAADPQADRIVTGLTAYARSGEFLYNLRRLIGLKIGGEIADIPEITPPVPHPRAAGEPDRYHINFQDPNGQPTDDPLVVDGRTYLKIGGNGYDQTLGYGWAAPSDVNWTTAWLDDGPNALQRSILYSDYGRKATLEFDLPNGEYSVTVSVGWAGRTYPSHKVAVEGVDFVNGEATTPGAPYIVRAKPVTVKDYGLTVEVGDGVEYTMLNYVDIEPTGNAGVDTAITASPPAATVSTDARFEFAGNKGGVTFGCSLDGATFTNCGSPLEYAGLAAGAHTFLVRATDGLNNTDDTPAQYTWTIYPGVQARFTSAGSRDGWVRESSRTSGRGGSLNSTLATFSLGDDSRNRQYRAVLSFNTKALPDNAVVSAARLKIRRQGGRGADPFATHGPLLADIRSGSFGNNPALQLADFQAVAGTSGVATFSAAPVDSWHTGTINPAGLPQINPRGLTQFRLRFETEDNDDGAVNVLRFFSGNYSSARFRPVLEVEYFLP